MDPNVFRKGDATSVLVVDKSWRDIIDKPDFFDELSRRIVEMSHAASSIGLLKKATTLRQFKNAINTILMDPLLREYSDSSDNNVQKNGSVLVDAFWDEIIKPDDIWEDLKESLEKAYAMKLKIEDSYPLSDSSTMQESKDMMNEAVVKPLLGINEDE